MSTIFNQKIVLKVISWILFMSHLTFASIEGDHPYKPNFSCKPTGVAEFGFVLLPDPAQLEGIRGLILSADEALSKVSPLPQNLDDKVRDGYNSVLASLPHVSVGQYAALGSEVEKLKAIVEEVAAETSVMHEPMKGNSLSCRR